MTYITYRKPPELVFQDDKAEVSIHGLWDEDGQVPPVLQVSRGHCGYCGKRAEIFVTVDYLVKLAEAAKTWRNSKSIRRNK